jgi:hypothetical protein
MFFRRHTIPTGYDKYSAASQEAALDDLPAAAQGGLGLPLEVARKASAAAAVSLAISRRCPCTAFIRWLRTRFCSVVDDIRPHRVRGQRAPWRERLSASSFGRMRNGIGAEAYTGSRVTG